MTRPVHLASLVVGDWVVARAERSLEAEYALFQASDVLLTGTPALGTREQGYLTTAGIARTRLADAGITVELAQSSLQALGAMRELARTPRIAQLATRLGPGEAFQGGVFDEESRRYRGAWLDLLSLGRAAGDANVALAMQLVHLASVLDDVEANVPVRLMTSDETRAGERTWHRVETDFVHDLPRLLAAVRRPFDAQMIESGEIEADLVADLHARATISPSIRGRLHTLASALSGDNDVELIVTDELEVRATPLLVELHNHRSMLHGETHLREVAQFFTAMAEKRAALCDLAILASRAWLASGEIAYARYFARRVVDDATATLAARAAAREILESTTPTNQSMRPPPVMESAPQSPAIDDAPPSSAPPGASLPPMVFATGNLPPVALRTTATSEVIETMPAPDDDLRARMTKIAREVARDYRLAYGITLKTDIAAIEAMQRHLRRRFADARTDERLRNMLVTELTRHGALVSEILARALGATWSDASDVELGRWSMLVPPGTLVHPIGRVYRFFQQDHREPDLIAYFAQLEAGARPKSP